MREELLELLEKKPAVREDIEAILIVDSDKGTWTFDDVPVDSGTFGELVSRGVVEKTDGEYSLSNPEATKKVLKRRTVYSTPEDDDSTGDDDLFSYLAAPRVAALAGTLVVVIFFRIYVLSEVYENGDILLLGNDPWGHRYYVEQLVRVGSGPFDISVLSSEYVAEEPLTNVLLWWFAELFGSSPQAAGHVLAWYPVVAGVVTAIVVYLITMNLTGDIRAALAAVLALAVIPAHALRTAFGFSDHSAMDYVWLVLTVYYLVSIGTAVQTRQDLTTRRTWMLTGGLILAITAQTVSWLAAPLLLVPIGLYIVVDVPLGVHANRSPGVTKSPIIVALVAATLLSATIQFLFDWLFLYIVYALAGLSVGVVAIVGLGELWFRYGWDTRWLVAIEGGVVTVGGISLLLFPPLRSYAQSGVSYFTGFTGGEVAEATPLFGTGSLGVVVGPLLLFGFLLFLALAVLISATATAVRKDRSALLVVVVYSWFLFILAGFVQRRFTGELSLFVAVLVGIGFVRLAQVVEIVPKDGDLLEGTTSRPAFVIPGRRTILNLLLLFLLVGGFAAIQTPLTINKVVVEDEVHETALWINDYAEREGLTYPENKVLSRWSSNRVYNYFVNGEAEQYTAARATYEPFIMSETPINGYVEWNQDIGFVVTRDDYNVQSAATMYSRLHHRYGSRGDGVPGLGNYRAVYAAGDGRTKVFEVVPGATVVGQATPNSTVTTTTNVSVPGASFTYTRRASVSADGIYTVTVPYPGAYSIENGTVTVSEMAVRNGSRVYSD